MNKQYESLYQRSEDSRMVIDENGANGLNGKGGFLFRDSTGLHRGQVPYISDEDFERLCACVDTEKPIC